MTYYALDRDPESPAAWDAQSLKGLLTSKLAGQQVIVVSNRQPFTHDIKDNGVKLSQPASGLVTAMEPVVRACGGTWIAHGSGQFDRNFVDANDRVQARTTHGTYTLRRIWLTSEEERGYYDGFSNSGLWPLCHLVHVKPVLNESDWLHYCAVNQRFADAVISESLTPNPIVLVQDYHLALVPAMVRTKLPYATVISFWHIPWPHPEQMRICPWLPELLDGLLGSDIVGFQTQLHANNFIDLAKRCSLRVDDERTTVVKRCGHATQIRDYPISIAWPTAVEDVRSPISTPSRSNNKLILGVDRFDYTKGILERLLAFEHLLDEYPQWQGLVRFVQIAAPTRSVLNEYASFQKQVFSEVARINAKFAVLKTAPVVLLNAHHDRAEVDAFYRAADICLVTSLDDGMNLVCKEFIAARSDERGILVLSEFAGAANELNAAVLINPYHIEQVAGALHQALLMPDGEQMRRMRIMRRLVKFANVYRWAANMLSDAASLRESMGESRTDSMTIPLETHLHAPSYIH
jgi:trehalose-6-phosphate synthase